VSGKKSRDKGTRGEREAAKYLRKLGFEAERNARNGISTDDLHLPGLPNVCVEVKYGYAAMDLHTQSLRDAWEQAFNTRMPDGRWPSSSTVLWKPPRKPWRLTWMDPHGLSTTTGDAEIKHKLLELNGDTP
jgi:Holliday junction resolvase